MLLPKTPAVSAFAYEWNEKFTKHQMGRNAPSSRESGRARSLERGATHPRSTLRRPGWTKNCAVGVSDPGQLQPSADHVELAAELPAEVQDATAAELATHLSLLLTTTAAALRQLERERRAQRKILG